MNSNWDHKDWGVAIVWILTTIIVIHGSIALLKYLQVVMSW